jgi:hypothetical protein
VAIELYNVSRGVRRVGGNNIRFISKKQSCIEALVALRQRFVDCGANVKWPMIS